MIISEKNETTDYILIDRRKCRLISVRVAESVKEKLDAESELESISINTLISQILTKHVEWDAFLTDLGFVFMPKAFLRAVLNKLDDETIKLIAVGICREPMRDAVNFIYGSLSVDSLIKTVELSLGASKIPFRHIAENGKNTYIIQHSLGAKWTIYFKTVFDTLLGEMGYHTTNQIATEHIFAFEIAKEESSFS